MISDPDGSHESRYFLNVANERTCFASCASSGLITCLEYTSDYVLNEINGGCEEIFPKL